jgi:hypothetical protein
MTVESSFAEPRTPAPTAIWLALAALQTGVLAGIVALVYLMLDGLFRGEGPWAFLNLLGATFYPRRAFSMAFSKATIAGLALHVAMSGISGLVFAILLRRSLSQPIRALWMGSFMGGIWYYFVFRYVWARIDPALVLYQSFPSVFLAHMVFGFCMGLYPRFVQTMPLRRNAGTHQQAV